MLATGFVILVELKSVADNALGGAGPFIDAVKVTYCEFTFARAIII